MLLTSVTYLLFLAIVFFVYSLLADRPRASLVLLLIASYYFYALWNPWCIVFLLLISTIDFAIALAIGHGAQCGGAGGVSC